MGDLKVIFRNSNRDIVIWRHQPCRNGKPPFCHVVDNVLKCLTSCYKELILPCVEASMLELMLQIKALVQSKALNEGWLISRVAEELDPLLTQMLIVCICLWKLSCLYWNAGFQVRSFENGFSSHMCCTAVCYPWPSVWALSPQSLCTSVQNVLSVCVT